MDNSNLSASSPRKAWITWNHMKILIKHLILHYIGSGRAFCSEIGSFCQKNKSRIFVNGIIYDNEMKERTCLFLMVLM